MSLGPRLDLRQSQSLVMTPQLQQAIKLLALTNVELEAYIGEELDRNPLLDTAGEDAREDGPADGPAAPAAEDAGVDQLVASGEGTGDTPLDVDYAAETFHHDSASDGVGSGAGSSSASGADAPDFDSFAAAEASLSDLLVEQAVAVLSGAQLMIARHLIDLIDEAGYLTGTIEDVADRLDAEPAEVIQVLRVIQGFEPCGVGARTLGECLAIQAREADRYDPAMACLLEHLDLVARGDLATLRRICGVDQEDMSDMIRELRGYNPKPGLRYGGGSAQAVIADVFVSRTRARDGQGLWRVELNTATLPRVLVDRNYYADLSRTGTKATKTFLTDCLTSANWLVKALDQRANTIVKVATELVKQQQAFFEKGVHHLRPLTLRAIAEEIGMHESTVSRVTSNKYLQCERGLFEFRYFFTSAIQATEGGDAVSASAVRDRIARLIAAEPPHDTLSDDKLVDVLRAEGFDIARRTVAKYREAMSIGSSVARRRAKLLEAAV